MILNRIGNKKVIAKELIKYFPKHDIYIEGFFGAGGLFFNKELAKKSILNDLDDKVFNLYQVVLNHKEEFKQQIEDLLLHGSLFEYWKKNKEQDPIKKAVRFIFLSNFSFMGKMDCFSLKCNTSFHNKENIINMLDQTYNKLKKCYFHNKDIVKFLNALPLKGKLNKYKDKSFIYLDPPYIETSNNYNQDKFTKEKFIEMLETVINMNVKFAISEFNNQFVIDECKLRELNIINVCTRINQQNKSNVEELLITNYDVTEIKQESLF